ncbi:MAG: hypothetical protein HYV07_07710 [Deltaproteobacteria bacterium]|nr:hypothetical protein [Deltaproteobacteria bacterium]
MENDPTLALIGELSRFWFLVRLRHPDVPRVVLLPAPAGKGHEQVLGHFAALRWSARQEGSELLHEVVVVAEHLNRGAAEVIETLLHEAAHAMNFARGIKDCSATSQYHNRAFRNAANELGLLVTKVPHYGFAQTSLSPGARERLAEEIERLDRVLLHRRSFTSSMPSDPTSADSGEEETESQGDEEQGSRNRKAICDCAFIIRVSRKTMNETTIVCETCGSAFRFD